eukprot:11165747-Lingulodinium_polyedra.AAC.1
MMFSGRSQPVFGPILGRSNATLAPPSAHARATLTPFSRRVRSTLSPFVCRARVMYVRATPTQLAGRSHAVPTPSHVARRPLTTT